MQTIYEARKACGMTQAQLAKLLGVTQGAVSQWEKGLTHPAFEMWSKLSEALGVKIEDLVKAG